jgi:SNF2 family DNA or RNA helicase
MPLPLFPFQEAGAGALATRQRFGLFDDMGVGKTAQSIRAADMARAQRGIVVSPASARANWAAEWKKFQLIGRSVFIGKSPADLVSWLKNRFDVLLLSYDMAARWAPQIAAECELYDFLILDEGHNLKDPQTLRAKRILGEKTDGVGGLTQWAVQAWWLTGTPIPNDPIDIYTFLRFVGVMPLTRQQFTNRYFDTVLRTYSAANTAKRGMAPELRQLIQANCIRRTLEQTGVELPPIWTTTMHVDGDAAAVRDLLLAYPGLDDAIVSALKEGKGLAAVDSDHVATLRRLIGEGKAPAYAEMLADELDAGLDKMVVFGIHRKALGAVADYLTRRGHWCVSINGSTSASADEASMLAFQSNPRCRVLIGNIRAAGTALTMTAACHIDMLESDWSPAGNAQAL